QAFIRGPEIACYLNGLFSRLAQFPVDVDCLLRRQFCPLSASLLEASACSGQLRRGYTREGIPAADGGVKGRDIVVFSCKGQVGDCAYNYFRLGRLLPRSLKDIVGFSCNVGRLASCDYPGIFWMENYPCGQQTPQTKLQ